jgi:hypothetical protein
MICFFIQSSQPSFSQTRSGSFFNLIQIPPTFDPRRAELISAAVYRVIAISNERHCKFLSSPLGFAAVSLSLFGDTFPYNFSDSATGPLSFSGMSSASARTTLSNQSPEQLGLVQDQLDDRVNADTGAGQGCRLRNGPRKSIEDKPSCAVGLFEPADQKFVDNLIRYQRSFRHALSDHMAIGRIVLRRGSEERARRNARNFEPLREQNGLRALARASRPHE